MSDILAGFQTFPEVDIGAILGGRRPIILAPHPDDESLGCGGLIAAACQAQLHPAVVILTDGAASHPNSPSYPPASLRQLREAEALRAVTVLGLPAENLHFLRIADTKLPGAGPEFENIVARIIDIANQHGCSLVIGPWAGDPHCDHVAGAAIAATVARQLNHPLLSYPVWGWLRPGEDICHESRNSGWRLNIAEHSRAKQRAIDAHASQYGDLIQDSPTGFKLPAGLLEIFARPFEVFIA